MFGPTNASANDLVLFNPASGYVDLRTAGHRQTRRDSRSTRQRGSGKVCETEVDFRCARYQNSAALAQVIYTKHSLDQELYFRPSFASFPKPSNSLIHSSSKQRCRAGS